MDRNGITLGGRYHLGDKIGTGGMSDVYGAVDELLGRDVAVKMMRPDLARDTSFLERFRREAQNAAALNHPAIVAVYDTGQTPDEDGAVPYIVMERVHGETLRDIVQEYGKMRLTDAANVMAQVLDALHFSHEAGIIHRDIKPANIMITNTGSVKVMDFGIARALSDPSAAMTQTAAVIGTAQYLSPEQARGKSADARSDIYSAGCVFYELATGQPPFKGESPFSVAFQHVQDHPPAPSSINGMHLSHREASSLDAIVLTAMAKDPDARYASAADMAADLRRLSEDQVPLVATVPAVPWPADSGAGTAGAAAGAAAATQGQQPHGHQDDSDDNYQHGDFGEYDGEHAGDFPETRTRRRGWVPLIATLAVLSLVGGGTWAYVQSSGDSVGSASRNAVEIPDVTRFTQDDAENRLEALGLEIRVTERPHADIDRGRAIRTEPAAKSMVPAGTQVTLVISSGKEITEVPDLTGKNTAEASRLLEQAGLALNQEVKEEARDDVQEGEVVSQSPAQGSQVSKGTKVTITVSTGPGLTRVPVVSGQTLSDARSNVESAGFAVEVTHVDGPGPEGRVLSASSEGAELPRGSTITLEVSKGNQIRMPDLTGRDYDQVVGALKAAGWEGSPQSVTRHRVATSDLRKVDTVARQSVRAGDIVDKRSSVDLGVYEFQLFP